MIAPGLFRSGRAQSSTARTVRAVEGLALLLEARFPLAPLTLCDIALDAVPLLNSAYEPVASAGDLIDLIVGELSPLLPDLAFELLPVSFDSIPVH
jgi:hypothetical protein